MQAPGQPSQPRLAPEDSKKPPRHSLGAKAPAPEENMSEIKAVTEPIGVLSCEDKIRTLPRLPLFRLSTLKGD
jgi:hypothetical protein